MGLRFYRRLKILPGLSLNLSGSGLSASFGPRGAKMTIGPRGVFGSVGIPGTGLSWREKLDSRERRTGGARSAPPALDPSKLTPEALEIMQAVVDGKEGVTKTLNTGAEVLSYWEKVKVLPGAHMIHPETGRRMSEAQVRAFAKKVDREAAIKRLTQDIAEEEARLQDAVRYWHPLPQIPAWESYVEEYNNLLETPFPEPAPVAPEPLVEADAWNELVASERVKIPLQRFFGRIFPGWASKMAEAKAGKIWGSHWAGLQARQEGAMRQHEAAVRLHGEREASWRERCAQEANERYALMAGENKEMLLAAACEAIDDLSLPFEADARVMLEDDVSIHLDVDLPEIENVVPQTQREVSSTGSIKSSKRSGHELNEPYAELVFGHSLNLAAKLFIELPRLQTVKLAAYTHRSTEDEYVFEASVGRDAMAQIAQSAPDTLADLLSALGAVNAVYELEKDSRLKSINRPDWTNN